MSEVGMLLEFGFRWGPFLQLVYLTALTGVVIWLVLGPMKRG